MARFRRKRSRASGFARGFAKRSRSRSSNSSSGLIQIDAMLYGAGRNIVSNLISPVTSMIPMGQYADEIGMGILNYYVAKKMGGMLGNVARKGLIVENAMVGSQVSSGFMGGNKSVSNTQVYG